MDEKPTTTLQTGVRSVSPVHIHLTDTTPLHVHVNKPQKPSIISLLPKKSGLNSDSRLYNKIHQQQQFNNNIKSLKNKLSNQSMKKSSLKGSKSSTNQHNARMKPSTRVSSSSSQQKKNLLDESEKLLRDKEKQLGEYEKKLKDTDAENKKLLDNIESICTELEKSKTMSDKYPELHREPDINRLGKSQLYLQALALKIDDFLILLRNIREGLLLDGSFIPEVEINHLMTQKKILERDLLRFDEVFTFLRREMIRLVEERSKFLEIKVERDDLLERVQRLSKSYEMLQDEFKNTNKDTKDLLIEMEALKTEQIQNKSAVETLRQTKAHLHKELTNKESENSRLASKVHNLESMLNSERIHNQELRGKLELDRENLKKAARLHKNRADKCESNLERVEKDLSEKDEEVVRLMEQVNGLKLQMAKVAKEKMMANVELNDFKSNQQQRRKKGADVVYSGGYDDDDDDGGDDDDDGGGDNKEEIKKLKEIKKALHKAELSLKESENESNRLKQKLGNSEHLIEDYKSQLNRQKQEIDELRQDLMRAKLEKDTEYNKPNEHLTSLNMNNCTNDSNLKLWDYETKLKKFILMNENLHNKLLLKEVELIDINKQQQQNQRQQNNNDNNEFVERIKQLQKKLSLLEDENRELSLVNAKREEALKQTNLRLEEKMNEGLNMQRQLDNLMMEARKMKDRESNKLTTSDRANQLHMLEVEGQLNQLKHEVAKLKREKEEAERRFNQRTLDMKDRLEQSCSTNRTLQNYIHFLKNSYACAFNDTPHITSLSRVPDLTSRDFLAGDYVGNIGTGGGNII